MKRILLFPPRVITFLTSSNSKAFRIVLMVLVFITALYTKEYRGEYRLIINNHIGGIFYVLFISLLFSVIFPQIRYYWSVVLAFEITCLLELIQYFQIPFMVGLAKYKAFAYLFGTSYNPVDLIYYFAGAVISLLLLLSLKAESNYSHARER